MFREAGGHCLLVVLLGWGPTVGGLVVSNRELLGCGDALSGIGVLVGGRGQSWWPPLLDTCEG